MLLYVATIYGSGLHPVSLSVAVITLPAVLALCVTSVLICMSWDTNCHLDRLMALSVLLYV